MSRLQRHRQNQTIKRLILLVIFGVIVLYFGFQIGLNSLINAAIFVNNLVSGSTNTKEEISTDTFIGTVDIDEPESATNSATLKFNGSITGYDQAIVYLNNAKQDEVTIEETGIFTHEVKPLEEGENEFYLIAKTKDGKKIKKSDIYTVQYIHKEPTLEIENISDGQKTNKSEIEIKGKTDAGVSVKINNSPVVVGFEGQFSTLYRLKEGENKLTVIASDIAGNETKKELKIIYDRDE